MSEPIVTVDEVRRQVLQLMQDGIDHDDAVHSVAVALHLSTERVEEIFCADAEQAA